MGNKGTDFIIETNGQCFFCLNYITHPKPPDKLEQKSLKEASAAPNLPRSIQSLSRYLKIDMREVFIGDEPISPNLLAKVRKSKLKVELCAECIAINDKFSELNMQLEKVKMEMKSWLQHILDKLDNDEELSRTNNLAPMTELEKSILQRKLEIVEAMRKETMQRCSIKISKNFPRTRIQKLTKRQENQVIRNRRKKDYLLQQKQSKITEMSVTQESISHLNQTIKSEPGKFSDDVSDSDYGENNSFNNLSEPDSAGTSDDDSDKSFNLPRLQPKKEHVDDAVDKGKLAGDNQVYSGGLLKRSSKRTEGSLYTKCIIDPQTNKHTCRDCSRIFPSFPAFYLHYKAEHLKIRYECSVCNQKFKQIGNYNRHQKVSHKGTAYKCRDCNQIFSLESNLLKHRGPNGCMDRGTVEDTNLAIVRPAKPSTHPKKIQSMCVLDPKSRKYNCKLCAKKLSSIDGFRRHYNISHLKVKYKCLPCRKVFSSHGGYRLHHANYHKGSCP